MPSRRRNRYHPGNIDEGILPGYNSRDMDSKTWTAFSGIRCVAAGSPHEVVRVLHELKRSPEQSATLIFDDETAEPIELDLRGDPAETLARVAGNNEPDPPLALRGPGRPRLGVVAREVTLLPRHWEWLNGQPGGASVTLRKLVDEARCTNAGGDRTRRARERAYRFMHAIAGDQAGNGTPSMRCTRIFEGKAS